MGRHGSPGPVAPGEKLFRILVPPHDVNLSTEAVLITALSHTETKGMSVLRAAAHDEEFLRTASDLLKNSDRQIFGVAEINVDDVRNLKTKAAMPRRAIGDRHYIVTDTDMPGLPHHADVFNTFPPAGAPNEMSRKNIWRKERQELLKLVSNNVTKVAAFKGGLLQSDHHS